MSSHLSVRPESGEYDPYFQRYVDLVSEGDILEILQRNIADTADFLGGLTEEQGGHRYAPDKWTLQEVVGHITDTERVFVYRALRFSRGDTTPLPGFEQDAFVRSAAFGSRTLGAITAELVAVRGATLAFLRGLTPEQLCLRGVADGAELSVRAIPVILAGHELHHMKVIRERYLAR